ncbi:unnamed protein product [Aspergillus oryzae]|uniref:Unnamed protein product n=1 Tax=Aspergillus oryzae TaxID=5062 RepID=A0AAN4Y6E8_ASPOZ|nr:unnamed protein product [Aspergillus oryzae]
MSAPRLIQRFARPSLSPFFLRTTLARRSFGSSAIRPKDDNGRAPSTAPEHREYQTNRPPNQHVPNTTSTMTRDFPKAGEKSVPPEFVSAADPNYKPADPYPGKVEHFTGGRQETGAQKPELGVGEMEGITFKVEPLKRTGEDVSTIRARLLCEYSPNLEYDRFLDENDWDIYYWATQDPPTEDNVAEDTPTETWKRTGAKSGEWAQTVGAYKAAYRPVPSRWADSEVLRLLRQHVQDNSATGFHAAKSKKTGGAGLGRMPNIQVFDS